MNFKNMAKEIKDPTLLNKSKKSEKKLFENITFKNQIIKESVLDPINNELCQDIFIGDKMKADVRVIIKKNFMNWWNELGHDESEIIDMVMIGSSTGYQYSKTSDIDVNVYVDIPENEFDDIWQLLPNGNMLLDTTHPVNYYLTLDDSGINNADSSYDLLDNKWIKKPVKSNYKVPYNYGLEIAKFFMYGIDNKIAELDRDLQELKIYKGYLEDEELKMDEDELNTAISIKETEIKADLDAINIAHDLARSFRKEAFTDDYESKFLITIETKSPNESLNNIVYKILERFGYFDKISKYDDLYDEYNIDKDK